MLASCIISPANYRSAPMHRDLIDILACPTDKAPLTLAVEHADGEDVVAGALTCATCGTAYPIRDSIPNLLPPNYPG